MDGGVVGISPALFDYEFTSDVWFITSDITYRFSSALPDVLTQHCLSFFFGLSRDWLPEHAALNLVASGCTHTPGFWKAGLEVLSSSISCISFWSIVFNLFSYCSCAVFSFLELCLQPYHSEASPSYMFFWSIAFTFFLKQCLFSEAVPSYFLRMLCETKLWLKMFLLHIYLGKLRLPHFSDSSSQHLPTTQIYPC